jgi:hypothetical protein
MVNVAYHTAKLRGKITRALYKSAIPLIAKIPLPQTQTIPATVYALSCDRDLPEQVASIRSFIRQVGIPKQFIVISDGSYSHQSRRLLHQLHPCITVIEINTLIRTDLPTSVYEYAALHPMGKKLAALLSIPVDGTTIYTDSDILFFPGAHDLVRLAISRDRASRFLPDCANKLDQRVLYHESENLNPINAGFIVLKEPLDWDCALDRLSKLDDLNHYFTEQTLVHLTLHRSCAKPLDSDLYVLSIDDQFIYPDRYAQASIALRHYVNNVRHKFWFNPGI